VGDVVGSRYEWHNVKTKDNSLARVFQITEKTRKRLRLYLDEDV